ncbi:hypothetical protein ACJ41O_000135 [Fusarium nematophilum]
MAHSIRPEPLFDTQPTPLRGQEEDGDDDDEWTDVEWDDDEEDDADELIDTEGDEEDEEDEDEDDKAEMFSAVLAHLHTDRLPSLAATVRQRTGTRPNTQVPVIDEPIYGSYHVLFPLLFPDGTRWLAKIPANGTPTSWDAVSSRALSSEANTMRLLKRETTIPLPEVIDFSATTENEIGCPYMLISFIPGKPLYEIWFGHRRGDVSEELVQSYRARALKDIALAMAQLKRFSFDNGGFLTFDSAGEPSGIGPMRHVDHQAMLDRWFIHQDPADDPIYVESPVFSGPRYYYAFSLGLHEADKPFPRGAALLLKQLINHIPSPPHMKPFVLAHPDYDIQNFIVSETGELQGIIDWDGVAAVPRSIGSERYPSWLTRDWDPTMYGYDESMDNGAEPEGAWEDSPDSLRYYRGLYREMISGCAQQTEGPAEEIPNENITRMSLITENLAIAAQDPQCRNDILRKIVDEISALLEGKVSLDFMDLVDSFASGGVSDEVVQALERGMKSLWAMDGL